MFQGRKYLRTGDMSRAGSVSRPEVAKSLRPELSIGWTWFLAASRDIHIECSNSMYGA